MKNILLIFSLVLLASVAMAQETSQKIFCDKSKSSITYSMKHPLHAWTAISKEVTSVIITDSKRENISQVAVSVKIASFDSKNANRDSHTIEVTEALKFPLITFSSSKIEQNGNQLKVTGILNFHNVNKEISFDANSKSNKGKLRVTGGFAVQMTTFGIDPPTLMAISTEDNINIEFDIEY